MRLTDLEKYSHRFAGGLRSVESYVATLCHRCVGACGESPDDQCLVSGWSSCIQAAFREGLDAFELGRSCALTKMAEEATGVPTEGAVGPEVPLQCPGLCYPSGSSDYPEGGA